MERERFVALFKQEIDTIRSLYPNSIEVLDNALKNKKESVLISATLDATTILLRNCYAVAQTKENKEILNKFFRNIVSLLIDYTYGGMLVEIKRTELYEYFMDNVLNMYKRIINDCVMFLNMKLDTLDLFLYEITDLNIKKLKHEYAVYMTGYSRNRKDLDETFNTLIIAYQASKAILNSKKSKVFI